MHVYFILLGGLSPPLFSYRGAKAPLAPLVPTPMHEHVTLAGLNFTEAKTSIFLHHLQYNFTQDDLFCCVRQLPSKQILLTSYVRSY